MVLYFRFAITPFPIPKAEGVTPPCHQVRTLRPPNFWIRRVAATSGGLSCLTKTSFLLPAMIIGPPGQTGWISIVLWLPGWTMGEGSGVRKTRPGVPPAFFLVLFGGGRREGAARERWALF